MPGWLTALKGLLLMAFPASYRSVANHKIGAITQWWAVFIVFALVRL
jgi:hypothetical protein